MEHSDSTSNSNDVSELEMHGRLLKDNVGIRNLSHAYLIKVIFYLLVQIVGFFFRYMPKKFSSNFEAIQWIVIKPVFIPLFIIACCTALLAFVGKARDQFWVALTNALFIYAIGSLVLEWLPYFIGADLLTTLWLSIFVSTVKGWNENDTTGLYIIQILSIMLPFALGFGAYKLHVMYRRVLKVNAMSSVICLLLMLFLFGWSGLYETLMLGALLSLYGFMLLGGL